MLVCSSFMYKAIERKRAKIILFNKSMKLSAGSYIKILKTFPNLIITLLRKSKMTD